MRYKELSDEKAEAMEKVVENKDLTVEEAAAKIEKIETKLKFQAFGKSLIKGKLGEGFKANSILGEDIGVAPSQEGAVTPVGGKDSIGTQPSHKKEMDDILA